MCTVEIATYVARTKQLTQSATLKHVRHARHDTITAQADYNMHIPTRYEHASSRWRLACTPQMQRTSS